MLKQRKEKEETKAIHAKTEHNLKKNAKKISKKEKLPNPEKNLNG